jgi:SNF2 family DNA or RNA helicase
LGEFLRIDESAFRKIERIQKDYEPSNQSFSGHHLPFLISESEKQQWPITMPSKLKNVYRQLRGLKSIRNVSPPKELTNVLRDYQKKGFDWLMFLDRFYFCGILADEMGLGKTLQVLTLIKKIKLRKTTATSLVVCPTSLIWNWEQEASKFLPKLKTIVVSGTNRRHLLNSIDRFDLVITSYGLLRRDISFYENFEFEYAILDEAQNIKNRNTFNAKAAKKIRSRHRLVLTGTPLENSVADLWSIFDFLMPGFLGSYDRFRRDYEIPILQDSDQERLRSLTNRIQPFLLRRIKTEVIKELPNKIEQVSYCDLEPTQQKCYLEMLKMAQKEVVDAYQDQGFHKSRMKILTVIMRLRQICCHPELAGIDLAHRLRLSSKLNMLKEIVRESVSGGHKILIFSQFVKMLKINEEVMISEGISYSFID